MTSKQVGTRINEDQKSRLDKLTDGNGLNEAQALRMAIDRGLDDMNGRATHSWLLYLAIAAMVMAGLSVGMFVLAEWPPRSVALYSIWAATLFAMAYLIELAWHSYQIGKWGRSS